MCYGIEEETMSEQSLIDDKYIKLAIALKANELKREQLSFLTYQHVESALIGKWKYEKVDSVHDAVNDVMQLSANDVVAYLSNEAILLGAKMKINDFEDLFGGDKQ